MQAIWSFIRDPFGLKRIARLEKELAALKATRPAYSARTNYMETLAVEFAKALPQIDGVHPDVRAQERRRVAFQMARDWIHELDQGAPGEVVNG